MTEQVKLDVLCVGHASYDLVFSVNKHPGPDEKNVAENLIGCGGGPAANAAVCVAKLGLVSGFAGYLGCDLYGDRHLQEFKEHHVDIGWLVRGETPTPLSVVLVKPDGKRSLINYKGGTKAIAIYPFDLSNLSTKVVLFDGHEPCISMAIARRARQLRIPTVLDAGSVHEGTLALLDQVDYLVCSEKFANQYANDCHDALDRLAKLATAAVVTLGDRGLIWRVGSKQGRLSAYSVNAVDTTGAGDAFHGAFAAALSRNMEWHQLLRYASAAGALCCTRIGARLGLPDAQQHDYLFNQLLTE